MPSYLDSFMFIFLVAGQKVRENRSQSEEERGRGAED